MVLGCALAVAAGDGLHPALHARAFWDPGRICHYVVRSGAGAERVRELGANNEVF